MMRALRRLRQTMRPAACQDAGRKPFFEGWYVKLVDRTQTRRLALIPGMYRDRDPSKSTSFLQVFCDHQNTATILYWPLNEFTASHERFDATVAGNRLGSHGVELDIRRDNISLHGSLQFDNLQRWPVTRTSPGIMGWYAWVPRMECYHGVVSLDHQLRGSLWLDGEELDFTGGHGYIEKDWGRSFPQSWVWLQCNHFTDQAGLRHPATSLTASIAHIPWLGRSFPGFIVGLLHAGKLHRFTTYTGARVVELEVGPQQIHWVLQNRRHRLKLVITRAETTRLPGPTVNGMTRDVHETLAASVELWLHDRRSNATVVHTRGSCAGLEVMGDTTSLAPRP